MCICINQPSGATINLLIIRSRCGPISAMIRSQIFIFRTLRDFLQYEDDYDDYDLDYEEDYHDDAWYVDYEHYSDEDKILISDSQNWKL